MNMKTILSNIRAEPELPITDAPRQRRDIAQPQPQPHSFPPQVRRSEAAAAAAQAWHELESACESLRTQLGAERAQSQVFEESNKILHEEIQNLKSENTRLLRENTVIHTRLRLAADILVNIMKPIETEAQEVSNDQAKAETQDHSAASKAAVAAELGPIGDRTQS